MLHTIYVKHEKLNHLNYQNVLARNMLNTPALRNKTSLPCKCTWSINQLSPVKGWEKEDMPQYLCFPDIKQHFFKIQSSIFDDCFAFYQKLNNSVLNFTQGRSNLSSQKGVPCSALERTSSISKLTRKFC